MTPEVPASSSSVPGCDLVSPLDVVIEARKLAISESTLKIRNPIVEAERIYLVMPASAHRIIVRPAADSVSAKSLEAICELVRCQSPRSPPRRT